MAGSQSLYALYVETQGAQVPQSVTYDINTLERSHVTKQNIKDFRQQFIDQGYTTLENVLTTEEAKEGANTLVGHIKDLHPNAWEGIVEMVQQLGTTGVMKFAKMLLALEEKNYHEAHLQMLYSRWRKQTKKRGMV